MDANRRASPFSIAIVATCLGAVFAGSMLVTPLYPTYQQLFGFSELTLTLVYSAYVLGNLATLLFLGQISDTRGRRPVVVIAIGIAIIGTLVFMFARSAAWLACGRALSGAAVGLASGTAAAWLADLYPREARPRAATLAVAANMIGLALGALLSGLLSEYAPWPLKFSYIVYIALLAFLGLLVRVPPETMKRADGVSSHSAVALRPGIGVPPQIRSSFFPPAATLFSSMALLGFYGALIPGILKTDLHQSSPAVGGAVIFELTFICALTVYVTRNVGNRRAMLAGLLLLVPCLALLIGAQAAKSMPVLIAGTTLAAVATAFSYRGSLQMINQIAPPDRRGEIVSAYLLCGFAGNSIPVIGVGVLSKIMSLLHASMVFACVIALLSVAGLIIAKRSDPDLSAARA
jgi:MFS family permease